MGPVCVVGGEGVSNTDHETQETFNRAKTWVKELQRQASPTIVIALAGRGEGGGGEVGSGD